MSATVSLTAEAGDTLDALLWRERGLGPADLPGVLELNPGLAAEPALLPAGRTVLVPTASAATPTLEIIQLWN